jgi:uncharacterized damage-inducible protein DinB
MNHAELLADAFGRVKESVHETVEGLTPEEIGARIDPGGNSVGWLIWHLTRVQDDHVAEVAGREQLWTSGGWRERFGLPLEPDATGFGDTPAQVARIQVTDPSVLTGYYDAVHDATLDYVAGLSEADLDRIVDERWDPPVSLGVRLVSVVNDDTQHVGQAAFLRGVLLRRR